jgi:hypothetical protein
MKNSVSAGLFAGAVDTCLPPRHLRGARSTFDLSRLLGLSRNEEDRFRDIARER